MEGNSDEADRKCDLINRCPIRYEWDPAIPAYDRVASIHDENALNRVPSSDLTRIYRQSVGNNPGKVLDIGCGTGRLLDFCIEIMLRNGPEKYLGIDPSIAMVKHAELKHGHRGFRFLGTRFEDFHTELEEKFDTIVARFGSASYVREVDVLAKVKALLRPNGRAILMFYPPWSRSVPEHYASLGMPGMIPLPDPPDTVFPLDSRSCEFYVAELWGDDSGEQDAEGDVPAGGSIERRAGTAEIQRPSPALSSRSRVDPAAAAARRFAAPR